MLAAWVALACVARAAALASTGISAAPPMPTSPEMMVRQCASIALGKPQTTVQAIP